MVPSCKEKRKNKLLKGPWLSTYSCKIWSINCQDNSEQLSRPADCYRNEPRTRRYQEKYLWFYSTSFPFYCISTKHNSTQSFETPKRLRTMRFMHWYGLGPHVCVREWVWVLQELWQVVSSWQAGEEYHVTHIIIPFQEGAQDLLCAKWGLAVPHIRRTGVSYIRMDSCKQMELGNCGDLLSVSETGCLNVGLHRVKPFQIFISDHT